MAVLLSGALLFPGPRPLLARPSSSPARVCCRAVAPRSTAVGARSSPLRALSGGTLPRSAMSHRRRGVSLPETAEGASDPLVPSATSAGDVGPTSDTSAESLIPLGGVLPFIAVACLGAFLFGYHLGAVNGPLSAISRDLGFGGNVAKEGLVVSSILVGAFGGSVASGSLSDSLGPRVSFIVLSIPLVVGALMTASAGSFAAVVAGRVITGVGVGISSSTVPTYIGEVSPTHVRGALGSLNQLMICVGILGALLANSVIPAEMWRRVFYISVFPAVLLALGMATAPDSPRFLLRRGRRQEAEAAATRLWGPKGAADMLAASEEDAEKAKGDEEAAGWGAVVQYKSVILVGAGLFFMQQISGINSVVYFSSEVFRQAGVTSDLLASVAVGATNVIGTLIATFIVDKLGRKTLLMGSFTGMGLSMCALAAALSLPALEAVKGPVAVGGTIAYVLSFALGVGPVPGLLLPEIFPSRIRGKGVAIAMGMHWAWNFMIGQTFLAAVTQCGISTVYTFFASVCLVACCFVHLKVPETKGKSLEDIEMEMLGSNV